MADPRRDPQDDARRVLQIARRRVFGRREVVFHRGDPADTLHLVHTGRFAVRINTPLGDTVMLNMVGPGETFGEIALLDDTAPRSATVVAVEKAETRAIHKLDFDALRAPLGSLGGRHPGDRAGVAGAAALRLPGRGALRVRGHACAAARGRAGERRRRGAADAGEASTLAGDLARDRQPRPARGAGPGEVALRRGRIEVLDAERLRRREQRLRDAAGVVGRVRVAGQRGDDSRAFEQDQQLAACQLGVGGVGVARPARSAARGDDRGAPGPRRAWPRALGRGVDDRATAEALLGVPATKGVETASTRSTGSRGMSAAASAGDDAVAALAQDLLQQPLLAPEMAVERELGDPGAFGELVDAGVGPVAVEEAPSRP